MPTVGFEGHSATLTRVLTAWTNEVEMTRGGMGAEFAPARPSVAFFR
jgi:hypothetical protein